MNHLPFYFRLFFVNLFRVCLSWTGWRVPPALFSAVAFALLIFSIPHVFAQGPEGGDPDQLPLILRYDAGGVDNVVKAIQWSPDGRTLYVAGWSKVVQVYSLDEKTGKFRYDPRQNFRIPVDAGRFGIIEAMAVSPDGKMLIVAGAAWTGESAAPSRYLWPRSSSSQTDWQQTGTIYVFDTSTRECRVLRGHQGSVRQLALVENGGKPTKLVSLGFENNGQKISHSVRLWSLETAQPMGQPLNLAHIIIPPSTDIPPRIQAWETSPDSVRVAVGAWKLQSNNPVSDLMIWSPLQNNSIVRVAASPVSFALQLTGQGNNRRIFCAGSGSPRLLTPGDRQVSSQAVTGLPATETPFASAGLPGTSDGAASRLVMISVQRLSGGDKEYRLLLHESGRIRSLGKLWTNRASVAGPGATLIEPAIAISPDGRFLSASGLSNNELRIYQLSDVVGSRSPATELNPFQKLSGRLVIPESAVFSERDGDVGIAISTNARATLKSLTEGQTVPEKTIVLSANQRSAANDTNGWMIARAKSAPWKTQVTNDRLNVEVTNGATNTRLLRVPADFRVEGVNAEVTAHTACAGLGDNPPLVAVASHIQGEPFLHVYDAESGRCLRMLRGHERRIIDLAFSSDGRFLLSASLDGTARGWMIEDIARVTKNIGWIPGLFVETNNDEARVERVDSGSAAARAGIRAGDIVRGIVSDEQSADLRSASQFYLRVSQTSPEKNPTIGLRIQRAADMREVSVPLEQGADLREPLFSVLISDEEAAGNPAAKSAGNPTRYQWLIWSPLGQFDVQGTQLQQQLGWQINTRNDAAPVAFSSVDQYRDRFLMEGLLRQLLGGAEVAVRKPIEPDMRLSMMTESGNVIFPNYEDELILREPNGHLVLEFADQTGEIVRTAEWSLSENAASPFSIVERDLWRAPIAAAQLGREAHLVTVRVTSSDVPPIEYTRQVFLKYQPAAPKLRLEAPAQTLSSVRSDRIPLRVAVDVATKTQLTFSHEFPDGTREESVKEFAESGIFSQDLTLKPGRNVIRLFAKNADIPDSVAEDSGQEESSVETVIEFAPVGPPQLVIDSAIQKEDQQSLVLADGKLQTHASEITIRGNLDGMEALTSAAITMEGQEKSLTGFEEGKSPRFSFSETIRLEPGEQKIVLSGAAGGETGSLTINAVYQPRLPEITFVSPTDAEISVDASTFDGSLPFSAKIEKSEPFPFDIQVLADARPVDPSLLNRDDAAGVLSGKVPLTADPSKENDQHRIEIQLSSKWNQSRMIPLSVRFLHPPKLVSAEVQRSEGTALADVICRVETSPSRPVSVTGLQVNGVDVPAAAFRKDASDDPSGDQVQTIVIPALPLTEGSNRIDVVVGNRDGNSAAVTLTEVVPPPPAKALVRMIRPLTSLSSSRPVQSIAFHVVSEPGLRRVELVVERDLRAPQRISLADETQLADPAAQNSATERTFEHRLDLTAGVNRVRVEVQNRGGVTSEEFGVTYLPPPVSITLKRLVTNATASLIKPVSATGNNDLPAFESDVDEGLATLEGDIQWIPGHRPVGKSWTIRVWVNGFLRSVQVPAPADNISTAGFQVPVVLNLKKNRLRVEAPEIAFSHQKLALEDHAIGALQNVLVSCARPEQRQRLHVVLMGVQIQDGRNICRAEDLNEFATTALRLQTPETAFADIKSYTPLVGEKAIGRNLRTLMVLVESQIAQRRVVTGVNDVVMFYYRGREHRKPDGELVLEDFQNFEDPLSHPQSISESYLAKLFEHLPGAHVVFLDIENPQGELQAAATWPRFPNLGLFRATWSGKEPFPERPGPLLSALEAATDVQTGRDAVSLGSIEELVQQQFLSSQPTGRFLIETFIPDDLAELIISRSASE